MAILLGSVGWKVPWFYKQGVHQGGGPPVQMRLPAPGSAQMTVNSAPAFPLKPGGADSPPSASVGIGYFISHPPPNLGNLHHGDGFTRAE
jgi:hypothetical protein